MPDDIPGPVTVTVSYFEDGKLTDHVFQKVTRDDDGVFITDELSEDTNKSLLLEWLCPDWKTPMERFAHYDGGVIAHNSFRIMNGPREDFTGNNIDDYELYVVTGFVKSE